jgi:hypothetical protein
MTQRLPMTFAALVVQPNSMRKMPDRLCAGITNAAPNDWRAAAWILERSWPDEYARVSVERVEPLEENNESKPGLMILYNMGGKSMQELLDFPTDQDPPEAAAEKQRRLLGQTEKASAPETISNAPPA